MNAVEQFTSNIRSKPPSAFSKRVENAYNQTIEWMKTEPHMYGFADRTKFDLNDDSPYGIARHFYWFFQTHNVKVYHSLLDLSDEIVKRNEISWLDNPKLCLLDIGAGTGAAINRIA